MINGKKIIGIAASVAMIAGAAACGGSSSNTTSTAAGNTSASASATATNAAAVTDVCANDGVTAEASLTVWAPSEDQVDDSSWLPVQEKAFEAANPTCKITWTNNVVGEDKAGETVKTDPAAAADVYLYANDQLGTLKDAGAVGQFSGAYLDQIKSENTDAMLATVTNDGQVYGAPYANNTWYMLYKTDVFTADDVKSLDTMLEKGKVSFQLGGAWYLWSFYAGAGATLFGADGTDESADPLFNLGDNAAKVTEYLINLRSNANFVVDDGSSGFANSDAVFTWGDTGTADEQWGEGTYSAAQPPTFNLDGTETQMRPFVGSKAAGYNPQSSNPAVAMAFAAYLGSADAQKSHYELRNTIPADADLTNSDATISADPIAVAQAGSNTVGIVQPTFSEMGAYWTPAGTFGTNLANGQYTADQAESATTDFQNALNEAVEALKSGDSE